jgi:hypothetical protein
MQTAATGGSSLPKFLVTGAETLPAVQLHKILKSLSQMKAQSKEKKLQLHQLASDPVPQ